MLALHILVSVGWIGAVAAYLVLDVTTATSEDGQTLRASYIAMGAITSWILVPLAWASLATGVVLSLATKWGLWRHWWVVLSLVLTAFAVLVLMVETATIASLAARAADPATTPEDLRELPSTLPHSVLGLLVLVAVTVLNVVKPRGLTPYGWRRQQERNGTPPDGPERVGDAAS